MCWPLTHFAEGRLSAKTNMASNSPSLPPISSPAAPVTKTDRGTSVLPRPLSFSVWSEVASSQTLTDLETSPPSTAAPLQFSELGSQGSFFRSYANGSTDNLIPSSGSSMSAAVPSTSTSNASPILASIASPSHNDPSLYRPIPVTLKRAAPSSDLSSAVNVNNVSIPHLVRIRCRLSYIAKLLSSLSVPFQSQSGICSLTRFPRLCCVCPLVAEAVPVDKCG